MYDVNYFIQKFQSIPEKRLITHNCYDRNGNGCAIGWCAGNAPAINCYSSPEYFALINLFSSIKPITHNTPQWAIADVNNGDHPDYQQPTPKQRILAALHDIKQQQINVDSITALQQTESLTI